MLTGDKTQDPRLPHSSEVNAYYVFGDHMVWPKPGQVFDEVQWRLRYGDPTISDLLYAASVMCAYTELVLCTNKKRSAVVRYIRDEMRFSEEEPI